jgi:hypothetical protein
VKVGSFPTDDTRLMIVSLLSGRRLRLQVIPSTTDPAEADRLLRSTPETPAADAGFVRSRWDNEIPWS